MSEFPRKYPDNLAFVAASRAVSFREIVSQSQSRGIVSEIQTKNQILNLMTPASILSQPNRDKRIITPDKYPDFETLLRDRQAIRDLILVPKRADEVQTEYEQMTHETFVQIVTDHYLHGEPMALVNELYPSNLPGGVFQYVLWIANRSTSDDLIAECIAQILGLSEASPDRLIMFERSNDLSATEYIRAAVPQYRHIHIWTDKPLISSHSFDQAYQDPNL